MSAIELLNVTKTFGTTTAVDDLSLSVPEGSIYGFIGPNGSGKTTTLRMIMRIYRPDRGQIRVLGEDHHAILDDVSYLPEERALYKNMRVSEVLKFFAQLKNHKPTTSEIQDWLARMFPDREPKKLAAMKVEQLSKGMSQKVQLIATLISKPKLVLLDEPFSGLDPSNQVVMRDAITDLRSTGTTVIFSTHDMAIAERMCDFVFMIHLGKKALDGTISSIRSMYEQDTIRVRMSQRIDGFASLPGVLEVIDHGNLQELRMAPRADHQAILAALSSRGEVMHFEVASPNLHDIFVRIVSPDQKGEQALA